MEKHQPVSAGVIVLIASTQKKIPEGSYTFRGDLTQIDVASQITCKLGFEVGYVVGCTYVNFKEDYDTTVEYITKNHEHRYRHYL